MTDKELYQAHSSKYGYFFDMFIIEYPYEKCNMKDIKQVLNGLIQTGNIEIKRECDVEEFITNSYSTYQRRFARMPKSLVVQHYGELYKNTMERAHHAIIADRPQALLETDEVLMELKGGNIDHDALANMWYVSLQKVKLNNTHTAIKMSYNSYLRNRVWPQLMDINLMISTVLSKVYNTSSSYGRVTSLSIMGEMVVHSSGGKISNVNPGKGILQEEMEMIGYTVNSVLDTVDITIGALHAGRELRIAYEAIHSIATQAKCDHSTDKLIHRIEHEIMPQIRSVDKLPEYVDLFNFSKGFIQSESTQIGKNDIEPAKGSSELYTMAMSLAPAISSYIMYSNLLDKDVAAEMMFLELQPTKQPER